MFSLIYFLSILFKGDDFMDYNELTNKPSINGVVLSDDLKLSDLGLSEMTPDMISELFLEIFGVIL
jgi:hypothetical protein